MRKKIISTLLLTVLCFMLSMQAYAAEPIKFGLIHSLSGGTGQVFGIPDLKAAQMAVDEINKAGGILGRPLEMIARDDKLNPEQGVREAKDLILNQKVQWIQGTVSSSTALAISAYCREAKVPFIITTSQSADLTNLHSHRYMFRTTAQTDVTTRATAIAAAKKWGGEKIFYIGPDYEFGHRCKEDFMKAYTKLVPGAKIVGELWPKLGNQDWTPYITKIMAANADFVYSSLWGGDVISFTKTAGPFGYFDRVKHCGAEWGLVEVLSRMDKNTYPKGVIGGGYYPYWLLNNPMSNEYWRKFNKFSGGLNAGISVSGYLTVYMMKKAIEKDKVVNMEKVVDALEGMELDTVVGKVKIRACDHQIMWPFWMGTVTASAKLPWPYIDNVMKLEPADVYMTCSEIAEARKNKK